MYVEHRDVHDKNMKDFHKLEICVYLVSFLSLVIGCFVMSYIHMDYITNSIDEVMCSTTDFIDNFVNGNRKSHVSGET